MNKKYIRGIAIPIGILLFFALGFLLAPNDPDHVDVTARFLGPCSQYPLGTDNMGRCVLSRLLYGGRTTLGIVAVGSGMVIGLGTVSGLIMGGMKKKQNIILESVLNAVTAIPPIAYLIIFIAAWGNGIFTVLTAATVSLLLRLTKLVKTRTEIESGKAYVMCAVASGATRAEVLAQEILPNLIWDILHFMCLSCADLIVSIVGFSFIGLGLGDNVIDWGMIISDTHHYFMTYPGMTFYPVIGIFLCTCSFYVLGRVIEKGEKADAGNQ
ncbi:ABC transporter permease [Lachnospiraceae bacterium 54-53]